MTIIKLKAGIRAKSGKGASRACRSDKKVPAVIYGDKKDPVAIELDAKEWGVLIKTPGLRTKLFEIMTPNGQENAMLIALQDHPVTDMPLHADFKRIDVKKPVRVSVPINVVNVEASVGIKGGGTLSIAVRNVAVVGLVENIPESIAVDLKNVRIGAIVHGSDLNLPAGVELGLRQAELAFVAITGKSVEETPVAAAAPAKGKAAAKPAPAKAAPAKPAKK
jgi:large subunit ribosomal protein L25